MYGIRYLTVLDYVSVRGTLEEVGGLVRKDTSPVKIKTRRRKPSDSRSQVPPMAVLILEFKP